MHCQMIVVVRAIRNPADRVPKNMFAAGDGIVVPSRERSKTPRIAVGEMILPPSPPSSSGMRSWRLLMRGTSSMLSPMMRDRPGP